MSSFSDYLTEIENRKAEGLNPKPIEDGALIKEIVSQIQDPEHKDRDNSLHFLIYNTLPGTTEAAGEKAKFLKEIILGNACEGIRFEGEGDAAQFVDIAV